MKLTIKEVLTAFFIIVYLGFSAVAVDAQEDKKLPARQLVFNTIPKTVPIKIEIPDNDLDSPPEEIVIKVTNTGDKPIYFLNLNVDSVEKIAGDRIGFTSLKYGNVVLGDFTLSAEQIAREREKSESLAANEFVELVITKEQIKQFNKFLSKRNYQGFPRMALTLSVLSFGDGTGFVTPSALPMPR
jgi:hypothetical protein